jgi:CheY-like chemotaxis protein
MGHPAVLGDLDRIHLHLPPRPVPGRQDALARAPGPRQVDDEEAARGPAADRLRELGHQVLEAADGPAALRALGDGVQVDLLVTDVGLPNGMNGRQVAEAVRERVPGLPVLFITGYAGGRLRPGAEVIGKPFELDTLARRVQTLLQAGRRESDRDPGA